MKCRINRRTGTHARYVRPHPSALQSVLQWGGEVQGGGHGLVQLLELCETAGIPEPTVLSASVLSFSQHDNLGVF